MNCNKYFAFTCLVYLTEWPAASSIIQVCIEYNITIKALSPIEHYRKIYHHKLSTFSLLTTGAGVSLSNNESGLACGRRADSFDSMKVEAIIHGRDAREKAWPWLAFIRGKRHMCSGALIAPQWILTVAHCINRTQYIALGQLHLNRMGPNTKYFEVSLEIIHENYVPYRQYNNDIALIKMKRPVAFNDFIRPICLPQVETLLLYNVTCHVAGWGRLNYLVHSPSPVLQELAVKIMHPSECRDRWLMSGFLIDMGHICSELDTANPGSGACRGDSGSPLSCEIDGIHYMVGAVSFGEPGCMKIFKPDVYTRIAAYKSWIVETIEANIF